MCFLYNCLEKRCNYICHFCMYPCWSLSRVLKHKYRLFRQKRTDFWGLYLCLYLSQWANKYGVRKPISRAFQNGMLEQNQTILRGSKHTFKKRPGFLYFFFKYGPDCNINLGMLDPKWVGSIPNKRESHLGSQSCIF